MIFHRSYGEAQRLSDFLITHSAANHQSDFAFARCEALVFGQGACGRCRMHNDEGLTEFAHGLQVYRYAVLHVQLRAEVDDLACQQAGPITRHERAHVRTQLVERGLVQNVSEIEIRHAQQYITTQGSKHERR